jgi:hypothetical protein
VANELILVVEDHDKIRKLVRDVLTFKGYEIIEAETGEEGVRLAQERHPSLVLMDIRQALVIRPPRYRADDGTSANSRGGWPQGIGTKKAEFKGATSMNSVQKYRVAAAGLAAGCLAVLLAGCGTATSGGTNDPSITTLMAGWQQKFDLDWQVKPEPGGTQRIQGYLTSRYGRSAEPVRVLVQALDGSGAGVGHRIAWVPGGVPGFGRSYFEVRHLPSADHFLVSVWDYSLGREPSSSQ